MMTEQVAGKIVTIRLTSPTLQTTTGFFLTEQSMITSISGDHQEHNRNWNTNLLHLLLMLDTRHKIILEKSIF